MILRVLGNESPFTGPDGAGPGYLLEIAPGCAVLLECGTGVTSALQHYQEVAALEAVVVSHLHPDHSADLFPLGFAVQAALNDGRRSSRLPLYMPPGAGETFLSVADQLGGLADIFSRAYDFCVMGDEVRIAGTLCMFYPTDHAPECRGVRVEIPGGAGSKVFAYTADSSWCSNLLAIATGADLLLCEAAATNAEVAREKHHLQPEEAGELARCAGAKHLLLTHLIPGADRGELVSRAGAMFSGPVEIAAIGGEYIIDDHGATRRRHHG